VPKSVTTTEINTGDWVTLSKNYAKEHGESYFDGKYNLLSKKVLANELFTDGNSINEFGYWKDGIRFQQAPLLQSKEFKDLSKLLGSDLSAWRMITNTNKFDIDSLQRNSKFFTDFLESDSFFSEGNSFTNTPREVAFHVFSVARINDQVFDTIVRSIPVDMMDNLREINFTPKMLLHNKAMLENVFSVNTKSNIPLTINVSSLRSLIRSITRDVAKISSLTNGAFEKFPTSFANTSNSVFSAHKANIYNLSGFVDKNVPLFQKAEPINSQSFRDWFSGSKVVNPDGSPMVVYHGTNKDFSIFDLG
jgi:hypothetical protein